MSGDADPLLSGVVFNGHAALSQCLNFESVGLEQIQPNIIGRSTVRF